MTATENKNPKHITFVGNYLPRACGIATFTTDLQTAVQTHFGADADVDVVAMNDKPEGYSYPDVVGYTVDQQVPQDYIKASEYLNRKGLEAICLQHEYGIFGGDDGCYILDLVSRVKAPVVVTLHTVLEEPTPGQKDVIVKMEPYVSRFVVMSGMAKDFLTKIYGIPAKKISMVHHGIPDMPEGSKDKFKNKLNLAGRTVLLTFGLLSKNKGIETVIKALPKVVAKHPKLAYVILGATHPAVKEHEGEAYRISLRRMVNDLGLEKNVFFHDQFVSLEQLTEYIKATDIYVTPYLSKTQITSGTLAYASGSGLPVVSTPYWYAEDILKNGVGKLFPFSDHRKLESILSDLLDNPKKLEKMSKLALAQGEYMHWPEVSAGYAKIFEEVKTKPAAKKKKAAPVQQVTTVELPLFDLAHVNRLTDDTGIFQHATTVVPNRKEGYCLDDVARALTMAIWQYRKTKSKEALELANIYLSYTQYSQRDDGQFHNFMSYQRDFLDQVGSEDSFGRALWALGYTVCYAKDTDLGLVADLCFKKAFPNARRLGLRGSALSLLGMVFYLRKHPEDKEAAELEKYLCDKLCRYYKENSRQGWDWFENELTYDNAIIPFALLKSVIWQKHKDAKTIGLKSLAFLEKIYFENDYLQLVGNAEWRSVSHKGQVYDEQPLDAMAAVLAFREAWLLTHEKKYLKRLRTSFDWFMGKNRLGLPLYDFDSKGCRDGLEEDKVNLNQGAESTLSFMISHLAMLDVAHVDALDREDINA